MPKTFQKLEERYLPATIWKRVFAYLLDSLIISVVIALPFQKLFPKDAANYAFFLQNPGEIGKMLLLVLLTAAMTVLYWSIFEYKFGQTLGKLILKIEVKAVSGKLTFYNFLLRNASKMSTLLLAIDCWPLITGRSHQRHLERMSNTEVMEKGWSF